MLVPFAYFPTHINLIDDDEDFLSMLKMILNCGGYHVTTFTDANEFILSCNAEILPSWIYKNILRNEEEEYEDHSVNIKVSRIQELQSYVEKVNAVSVVVADYDMLEVNGIDLCDKISSPHIQKVLLTGVVDEDVAVKAFNDGVINKYLKKHSPNLLEEINSIIRSCQTTYFNSLFENMSILFSSSDFLNNSVQFKEVLEEVVFNYKISEYYLISTNGSYKLINKDGKPYYLYTFSEIEIDALIEDNDLEENVEFSLKNGQKLIKPLSNGKFPPPAQWTNHLIPVRYSFKKGGLNYYLSLTDG